MNTSWKNCILSTNAKIIDVINNLDKTGFKIVLIIDQKKNFVGTITDGDIRRAIKRKISYSANINKIINKNPITVSSVRSKIDAFNKMRSNKINQIPIIINKKIHGIFSIEDIFSKQTIDNIFFLMSGGKGLRLGNLTKKIPKPLLEVGDVPIMERIILKAKADGFKNFVSSVNYKKKKIINYFKNGENLQINMKYIKENESNPLGTAGSLGHLKNVNLPVVISNADVLVDVDYDDLLYFHNKNKSEITVVTKINEIRSSYGEIKIKQKKILDLREKPILKRTILAGIYVLSPKIINQIKKNKRMDMTDLINTNIKKKRKVFSYLLKQDWIDIGSHESYETAQKKFT